MGLRKLVKSIVAPVAKVVAPVVTPVVKVLNKVDNAVGLNVIPDPPKDPGPTAAETAALKALQDEEAAFKKQVAEYQAQQKLMETELAKTQEGAAAQSAKLKGQSEVIQRESAERRLARLRARKRSTGRPMLASAGIDIKSKA